MAPLVNEGPALGHGARAVEGPILVKPAQLGILRTAGAVGDAEAAVHESLKDRSQPRPRKPVTAAGTFAGVVAGTVVDAVEEDAQGS